MSRAIITACHKYQPYGSKYYEPILDYFISNLEKYRDEFDTLYLLDSTWNIERSLPDWIKVIKVNPHLRYYDAYKEVLPQVKEELVMLMDNDMVVYKKGIIDKTFDKLRDGYLYSMDQPDKYDVVTIYDMIGNYQTDKLNGYNKFCPYWFVTRKDLLMKYVGFEWGPNMPEHETLGKLTEVMLHDGLKPFQMEEDKASIYYDGTYEHTRDFEKSKDLGYYHIRAGSTPAVLLAYRDHDREQYEFYIERQPKREYLRQFAWYWIMNGDKFMDHDFFKEVGVKYSDWLIYVEKFRKYHCL